MSTVEHHDGTRLADTATVPNQRVLAALPEAEYLFNAPSWID